MAKALTRLLESLGEPVLPFDLFDSVIECKDFTQAKSIISSLNPVHYNVFYYLMAFLRELLSHSSKNKLTSEQLGNQTLSVSSPD